MKIAILASTALPTIGGAEVFMHNLIRNLRGLGHDVHMITWWGNWIKTRGKLPYPVHPILPKSFTEADRQRLNETGSTTSRVWWQVWMYHQRFKFDVYQINLANPFGPLCVHWLVKRGMPVVMRCVGDDLLYDESTKGEWMRKSPVLGKAMSEAIAGCHGVTASCAQMAAGYREVGVLPARIARIPNGVDLAHINLVHCDPADLKRQHGIAVNDPVILTVGRHVAFKGFKYVPEILAELKRRGFSPWWVVVGEDSHLLVPRAKELGVADRFLAIARIGMKSREIDHYDQLKLPAEDLVKWYKTADFLMHPAILEPYGNIVMEAMAAGLPSVVSAGTGSHEYVEQAKCGLVARTHDVQDMADKVALMLGDPDMRRGMSERARAAAPDYDLVSIARRYASFYEQVIESVKSSRQAGSSSR